MPLAAQALPTLWLFGGVLHGKLPFFRELSNFYAPWYAAAAAPLRDGLWPLWNPTASAGEPLLVAYPVDLLLLFVGGWKAALGLGTALHLLIGLAGATRLAQRLGLGGWAAWLTGVAYGSGGLFVSLVNLTQLYQAAAWAPWVIAAFLNATRRPGPRRIAVLALLSALQVSTLGAEIVLQTAVVAVVLAAGEGLQGGRLVRMALVGLVASLLAAALAAPALLGVRALLEDTARGRGFSGGELLAYSLHPVVLLEVLLPRWLGDMHAFLDTDLWGRVYFPSGYPYFVTLYLGAPVLLLAAQAHRPRRLWAVAALGLVLGLGEFGPLGTLMGSLTLPLRGPQKLFFLTHLALSLLAGYGLERRLREAPGRRWRVLVLLPAVGILGLTAALRVAPETLRSLATHAIEALADPRAAQAARAVWPSAWLPSGALALGAGLALWRGGRWSSLAAVAAAVDLATVNATAGRLASPEFYELRSDVGTLLSPAFGSERGRLFSYGLGQSPGVRFEPGMLRARSDIWLYYLDRQSLFPRMAILDGLDGAFDLDNGASPSGSAFSLREAVPARFRDCYRRLRGAGVRWVLSFEELPSDLVIPRGHAKLPEIVQPLRLYELREARPRAYYVERHEVEPDPDRRSLRLEDPAFDDGSVVLLDAEPPSAGAGWAGNGTGETRVDYVPVDAHTLRIRARTPPGFIVVLDGHHRGWSVEDAAGGRVPLLRANGRYRAIRTPGGEREYTLRFRPGWRRPALLISLAGILVLALLAACPSPPRSGDRVGDVLDSASGAAALEGGGGPHAAKASA